MIEKIKRYLKRRKLKRQLEQSSHNLTSMEMASKDEWVEYEFDKKYPREIETNLNLKKILNEY